MDSPFHLIKLLSCLSDRVSSVDVSFLSRCELLWVQYPYLSSLQVLPDYLKALLNVVPQGKVTDQLLQQVSKLAALQHRAKDNIYVPTTCVNRDIPLLLTSFSQSVPIDLLITPLRRPFQVNICQWIHNIASFQTPQRWLFKVVLFNFEGSLCKFLIGCDWSQSPAGSSMLSLCVFQARGSWMHPSSVVWAAAATAVVEHRDTAHAAGSGPKPSPGQSTVPG